MSFQNFTVLNKLLVSFRHATFHGVQVLWCSNSSDHILSLFKEISKMIQNVFVYNLYEDVSRRDKLINNVLYYGLVFMT